MIPNGAPLEQDVTWRPGKGEIAPCQLRMIERTAPVLCVCCAPLRACAVRGSVPFNMDVSFTLPAAGGGVVPQ